MYAGDNAAQLRTTNDAWARQTGPQLERHRRRRELTSTRSRALHTLWPLGSPQVSRATGRSPPSAAGHRRAACLSMKSACDVSMGSRAGGRWCMPVRYACARAAGAGDAHGVQTLDEQWVRSPAFLFAHESRGRSRGFSCRGAVNSIATDGASCLNEWIMHSTRDALFRTGGRPGQLLRAAEH
eukprot:4029215-Pleurochrysis_carterae.AAC.5